MKSNVTIAGVEIYQDDQGRYNLNALHKSSGNDLSKAPAQWLRLKGTQELIEELTDMQIHTSLINSVKGGINQGTFAHELLAVSYAGWISPSFQLKVNQAFIDSKKQKQEIDFSNPIQLRDLLLENVNKVIKLQETVSSQESTIQSLESHFKDGMTVVEFCKQLNGVNVNAVNKFLSSKKWLHYDNQWRVSSYARDNYLTEISTAGYENSKGETIPTFKVVLLRNGVKRLFAMYLDGLLPMKSNWDRKFCHIKI